MKKTKHETINPQPTCVQSPRVIKVGFGQRRRSLQLLTRLFNPRIEFGVLEKVGRANLVAFDNHVIGHALWRVARNEVEQRVQEMDEV